MGEGEGGGEREAEDFVVGCRDDDGRRFSRRVDSAGERGRRGTRLRGFPSSTSLLPVSNLLDSRSVVSSRNRRTSNLLTSTSKPPSAPSPLPSLAMPKDRTPFPSTSPRTLTTPPSYLRRRTRVQHLRSLLATPFPSSIERARSRRPRRSGDGTTRQPRRSYSSRIGGRVLGRRKSLDGRTTSRWSARRRRLGSGGGFGLEGSEEVDLAGELSTNGKLEERDIGCDSGWSGRAVGHRGIQVVERILRIRNGLLYRRNCQRQDEPQPRRRTQREEGLFKLDRSRHQTHPPTRSQGFQSILGRHSRRTWSPQSPRSRSQQHHHQRPPSSLLPLLHRRRKGRTRNASRRSSLSSLNSHHLHQLLRLRTRFSLLLSNQLVLRRRNRNRNPTSHLLNLLNPLHRIATVPSPSNPNLLYYPFFTTSSPFSPSSSSIRNSPPPLFHPRFTPSLPAYTRTPFERDGVHVAWVETVELADQVQAC